MLADPADILKAYLKEMILIRLKNGEEVKGKLIGFDEYHSLLVSQDSDTRFIRGENILFVGQE